MQKNFDIKTLQIESPCPNLLSRMDKNEVGYYCKSCKHEVIDYRTMSVEEILLSFKKGGCGIFMPEQLPAQQKMPWQRQILFYGLSFLSFFGIAVSPVSAQNIPKNRDSTEMVAQNPEPEAKEQVEEKKKTIKRKERTFFRRKKKPTHVMGCPSF